MFFEKWLKQGNCKYVKCLALLPPLISPKTLNIFNISPVSFPLKVAKTREMLNMLNLCGLVLVCNIEAHIGIRPPIRFQRIQNIQKNRIFQTFLATTAFSPQKNKPPG